MPLPSAPVSTDSPPWWRLPIVWMVIGGPLVVVVASFATARHRAALPRPGDLGVADGQRIRVAGSAGTQPRRHAQPLKARRTP